MVTFGFLERIPHVIAGKARPGRGDRVAPVFDPATGRQTAVVGLADVAEVDEAVSAARLAQRRWREVPLGRRVQVLFSLRELVAGHEDELAEVIAAQHGKTLADARGEVLRGLECIEYACGLPELLKGEVSAQVAAGVDVRSLRQPVASVMHSSTPCASASTSS